VYSIRLLYGTRRLIDLQREEKVIIRLSADKKDEFQRLAEELGMTMSALGAYVIGNFLRTQRKVIDPLVTDIAEVAKKVAERVAEAEAEERSA
jgi:antitoxin component of RelBE/YafQ-DinJ toxin-antitoxin module